MIYVRAVLELLALRRPVHGLAHITGGGLSNLLRLNDAVGYAIDAPLPVPAVFELIQRLGDVPDAEMYDVFNMGCGFVSVVPAGAGRAGRRPAVRPSRRRARHRSRVTDRAGEITR